MRGEDSVEGLFRLEFPRLVRSLGVAFGVEEAADAVQEAFVEADRRWARVGKYDDPAAWVRRVALRRLLNERQNTRRRAAILEAVRPAAPAAWSTEVLELDEAVHTLPAQQRIAVCLYYLGGYQIDEVGEMMGIAAGTVKAHMHAARSKLRVALAEVE